jgi:hypothetical protein
MNNSTLWTADRATHLKIVVVALACATLIAGLGLAGRLNKEETRLETSIIKPAKSLTAASGDSHTFR